MVHYKGDLATRKFFAKHIPNFTGFGAHIQKWIKQRLAQGEVFFMASLLKNINSFYKRKQQKTP